MNRRRFLLSCLSGSAAGSLIPFGATDIDRFEIAKKVANDFFFWSDPTFYLAFGNDADPVNNLIRCRNEALLRKADLLDEDSKEAIAGRIRRWGH